MKGNGKRLFGSIRSGVIVLLKEGRKRLQTGQVWNTSVLLCHMRKKVSYENDSSYGMIAERL
jgi:hypothetical protein